MKLLRKWIPQDVRLNCKLVMRWMGDVQSGNRDLFAHNKKSNSRYPFELCLSQEIKPNSGLAEKLFNLKLAAQKINNLQVNPQAMFSFWHEIGPPTKQHGFKKGRNIIEDKLTTDYGGGLCQLSGIIYHVALLANMFIVERHAHSKDIYTAETRFTPLGSDATVVYGYKDLRWINSYPFPIILHLEVLDYQLNIRISSPQKIESQKLSFNSTNHLGFTTVYTTNELGDEIAKSKYQL